MSQGVGGIILLVAMFVLMYFTGIRPQQKKAAEMNRMREGLKLGDRIVTLGGIRGRVVEVRPDSILLETEGDGSRIEVLKPGVNYVEGPQPEEDLGEEESQAGKEQEAAEEDQEPAQEEPETGADTEELK